MWKNYINSISKGVRTDNMRAFNQRMAIDPNLESIILPVGQGLSIGCVKG